MRIYNRDISEPEIKALYNEGKIRKSGIEKTESNVPGQSEGGVSRYKLNGNIDDSWSDNNGTNNGADLTATGVYGQAAEFNGTSDYIRIPDLGIQGGGNDSLTVSFWFNGGDSLGSDERLVNLRENFEFIANIGRVGTDTIGVRWRTPSGGTEHAFRTISPNTWYHYTFVYNNANDTIKGYIDGVLEFNDTGQSGTFNRQNSIGNSAKDDVGYAEAKIDDVRIYDKALTPVQVERLYHKGAYRITRESTLQ